MQTRFWWINPPSVHVCATSLRNRAQLGARGCAWGEGWVKRWGVMNNCYFPQNNSSVVLDEKGFSWHLLSWYKSCVYRCVKGPHLCFCLLGQSFCLGLFYGIFRWVFFCLFVCFKYCDCCAVFHWIQQKLPPAISLWNWYNWQIFLQFSTTSLIFKFSFFLCKRLQNMHVILKKHRLILKVLRILILGELSLVHWPCV